MPIEDRFKAAIIATLAKRAANRCSNPDCRATTSGPAEDPGGSINVGEAAHIFGANPGAARFDPNMTPLERSEISNAIWLCSNCHKMIDDDPSQYPAGLLFAWQREHERYISRILGKAGAEIRQKYEDKFLDEFGKISPLAGRILLEKQKHWEYKLTCEIIRYETSPIFRRWSALKRGLYIKEYKYIPLDSCKSWINTINHELIQISGVLSGLIGDEFHRAWGEPGVPGNEIEIIETCRLYKELCSSLLSIEERTRFSILDKKFTDVQNLYKGISGNIIDELEKLPLLISDLFKNGDPERSEYSINLKFGLPEKWADLVSAEMSKIQF